MTKEIREYSVRESPRAKSVRLKMSPRDGLVVVVPRGFDVSRIPALLDKKRDWLERAAAKVEEWRKLLVLESPDWLPERIALRAIGREWVVEYRPTAAPWVAASDRKGDRLLVYGDVGDREKCRDALRRWVGRKAHEHLVPWLERLAADGGFQVNRILVKTQRTRWASCSQRHTISINRKLLFVPGRLTRYIFIHELCHTVHLNHSRRFWALVRDQEPNYKPLEEELRQAWRTLPAWLGTR